MTLNTDQQKNNQIQVKQMKGTLSTPKAWELREEMRVYCNDEYKLMLISMASCTPQRNVTHLFFSPATLPLCLPYQTFYPLPSFS